MLNTSDRKVILNSYMEEDIKGMEVKFDNILMTVYKSGLISWNFVIAVYGYKIWWNTSNLSDI